MNALAAALAAIGRAAALHARLLAAGAEYDRVMPAGDLVGTAVAVGRIAETARAIEDALGTGYGRIEITIGRYASALIFVEDGARDEKVTLRYTYKAQP